MNDSKIFGLIEKEQTRQDNTIELIASENYVSENVRRALGSCLTNKYAEGLPGKRYYGGCEVVDEIESYCQDLWKQVFHTKYEVNVQPLGGSAANLAAYMTVCKPGDTILAMGLDVGGHLSHSLKANFVGKFYNIVTYGLDENERINYEEIRQKLHEFKPAAVVAGASAYSRFIDFSAFRSLINELPEEERPYLIADISHISGLVAHGLHPTPFGYADIVTTTTQKLAKGPRGALIFCRPGLEKKMNSAVFPGSMGGPHMHVIAAKAICAEEMLSQDYEDYIHQVVTNAKLMAKEFQHLGYRIVSGGTANHMFLVDLSNKGLTGKECQDLLERNHIAVNKNAIPNDLQPTSITSGIRIGTPAMTTKGWLEDDFIACADRIDALIKEYVNEKV